MTGNAPVADSMPGTDNGPVCCVTFLPDECCVQLRKQFTSHTWERRDRYHSLRLFHWSFVSHVDETSVINSPSSSRYLLSIPACSLKAKNKTRIKLFIHNKLCIFASLSPSHFECLLSVGVSVLFSLQKTNNCTTAVEEADSPSD